MHSKIKGGLGTVKVVEYFLRREISVFTEVFCDNSEIDLIVQVSGNLLTIQVRCTNSENGCASLSLRRITPGTRKSTSKTKRFSAVIDIFALYVVDLDQLLFIKREEVERNKRSVSFRFKETKTRGKYSLRYAKDYLNPFGGLV